MRRAAVPLVLIALAACRPPAFVPPREGAVATPKPRPSATASAATAKGSPTPAPPARGAVTRLAGTISLDARYAVASGAMSLAPGGGRIISDNGGGALDPTGLFAPHAAGLIGKIRLIGDQGGGLVSNNGGGLIGNNGGGYRLAQAPGGALPAAGLVLGVYALVDGGLLPVGVDADGKPTYTLLTDADGGFAVELPAAIAGNVLITASVPGTRDPGLAVDLIARAAPADALAVGDASTVVTDYLLQAVAGRLEETYAPDPCRPPGPVPENADALTFVLDQFTGTLEQPAFQALPREARQLVLRRFAGFVIAGLDLPAVTVKTGAAAGRPALAVIEALIADAERAAAPRLAEGARAFEDAEWLLVARVEHGAAGVPAFRKASDLTAFMVREYLTTLERKRLRFLEGVLDDLGLDPGRVQGLVDAGAGVFLAIADHLQQDGVAARGQAILDAAIREAATPAGAQATACPPTTSPPAAAPVVSTFAGTGTAGGADGPAATAGFDGPTRLAIDPTGRWLYVTERAGGRIRAIDLQAADHAVRTVATGLADPGGLVLGPAGDLFVAERRGHAVRRVRDILGGPAVVTTLAGGGPAGFADGPGASARFATPTDVAWGADGALYVADTENRRIRRIDMTDPANAVTTFAGSGSEEGWAAGIGAAAGFSQPRGLLARPGKGFVVADTRGDRLGRLSARGVLTRLAGLEDEVPRDGSWYQATFEGPQGLALTPAGDIVVADTDNHRIRLLTRDGRAITLAGAPPAARGGPGAFADGPGAQARFHEPEGVAAAADGRLFVADTRNQRIRVIAPSP